MFDPRTYLFRSFANLLSPALLAVVWLLAPPAVAGTPDLVPRPRGAIPLAWFPDGGALPEPVALPWAGSWPGSGGRAPAAGPDEAGLGAARLASLPKGMERGGDPPARGGSLTGLSGSEVEDRRARLGAAFLAEVLGPRPSRPARLSRGAAGLRDLIASVEAGKAGYDAVVYGATVPPPLRPSQMSLAQIRDWIAATPGQNHAIGRYQIVPRTLDALVRRLGLKPHMRFDARLQDLMADALIADAGYHEFLAGTLPRQGFMENLAAIWAALPRADGRSAYDGVNGNRAGMTWPDYQQAMAAAFPR